MEFQIDPHTLERAMERGAMESEIEDVLQTGITILGKYNRLGKTKFFPFNANRLGKYYEEKKLEVYYIIEEEKIITVTVYVFYGKF